MESSSSSKDSDAEKRPQFGGRHLNDPGQVFEHNAWDNVEWDAEQQAAADRLVEENSKKLIDKELADQYESKANSYWDQFYDQHETGFFKDRHWLFTEFPELAQNATNAKNFDAPESSNILQIQRRIFEVGCGVRNTVFPILEQVNDPNLFIFCCDFSSKAIELVKRNSSYDSNRCHAFVCDVTIDPLELPFPEASLDVITLIFVLSAIHPAKMRQVVSNLVRYLNPGGLVLLRDYGRYDMAQLRFKSGRCLEQNFYVRGDGTRVYFFTPEELDEILRQAGLNKEINHVDRRLQVNRGKLLKMYRTWIQCKYRKPV